MDHKPGNSRQLELYAHSTLVLFEDIAARSPQRVVIDVGVVVDPARGCEHANAEFKRERSLTCLRQAGQPTGPSFHSLSLSRGVVGDIPFVSNANNTRLAVAS